MNARPEEGFVGVNVADASDQLLVEQNRFHRAARSFKDVFESVESNLERVWAHCACSQKLIDIFEQPNLPELARIIERQPAIFLEPEKHSGVRRRLFVGLQVLKRGSHAEMQSKPEITAGTHEQMFAVAATRFETASFQLARQLTGRNAFEHVRALYIHTDDPLT